MTSIGKMKIHEEKRTFPILEEGIVVAGTVVVELGLGAEVGHTESQTDRREKGKTSGVQSPTSGLVSFEHQTQSFWLLIHESQSVSTSQGTMQLSSWKIWHSVEAFEADKQPIESPKKHHPQVTDLKGSALHSEHDSAVPQPSGPTQNSISVTK